MKRLRWMLLSCVLSCGGSNDGEPVDMTPQGVCAFYAERDCASQERCAPRDILYFSNDIATCRERATASCVQRVTAPGTSETPERVAACAKDVEKLSCEAYFDYDRWPASCVAAPGKREDGAGCFVHSQCKGLWCLSSSRTDCGVCKTVSPIGGACTEFTDCLNYMPCIGGICVPHSKRGEVCNADRGCIEGLTCHETSGAEGTCGDLLPLGSPCDPELGNDKCNYLKGQQCDQSSRTCAQNDPPPLVGQRCDELDLCNDVSYCDNSRKCKLKPREGEPCFEGDCLWPARCIGGVCKLRDAAVCP